MELPIAHIYKGEKGAPVKDKLNTVIDVINSLGNDVTKTTGLLSSYVFFRNNTNNPNSPDIDILLFAYYGWLKWKVSGQLYQINLGSTGYNITLDAFDGDEGESRIDTVYAIAPPTLSEPETGIQVRKGENAEYPTIPGINTATEVLLGYVYVNMAGFIEGSGNNETTTPTEYKFDHHVHIVTQAEAEGGNFTFDVPNVIATNMGVHVYCNQLPLTYGRGYSIDLASKTSKTVTINKNNTDETYFAIKAGWPIFVGFYYKVGVPGTPENPPAPLSNVTLELVTHRTTGIPYVAPPYYTALDIAYELADIEALQVLIAEIGLGEIQHAFIIDEDQLYYFGEQVEGEYNTVDIIEYNSKNDVKFILYFRNTGSVSEKLNLKLTLVHNGSGGVVSEQNITHEVPANTNNNKYEITYPVLGNTSGENTYTLHVTGDRTGSNAVTVPAKIASWDCQITAATRNTTTTILANAVIQNTSAVTANKTFFWRLGLAGTPVKVTSFNVAGGYYDVQVYEFTGVGSGVQTVYLLDSNGTTVLDSWELAALTSGATEIKSPVNSYTKRTIYTATGTIQGVTDWTQSQALRVIDAGLPVMSSGIYHTALKILDVINQSSINSVVLVFTEGVMNFLTSDPVTETDLEKIQVHEHISDLRLSQSVYNFHYNYTNNNIVLSTEILEANESTSGLKEFRVTLDGQYFEGITDGYKGLLIKTNPEGAEEMGFLLNRIEYFY